MAPRVDARYLPGLLATAGRAISRHPAASGVVARVRTARTPEDLARILSPLDLSLAPPARQLVEDALAGGPRWKAAHAALVRSAEQSLAERFWPGS